jgi:hypothetical protein
MRVAVSEVKPTARAEPKKIFHTLPKNPRRFADALGAAGLAADAMVESFLEDLLDVSAIWLPCYPKVF